MNSKERVRCALRQEPVDRVPVFMWYHPSTAGRLAALLEIPVAHLSEALGDDVRQTWVNNNYAMEGIVHDQEGEGHEDFWGIGWRREGEFNQIVYSPLRGADRNDCLAYQQPWDHTDDLLALMAPVAVRAKDYFIGCDVSPCVFEMYARIRGLEEAALDLAMDPALAIAMMTQCADFAVALSRQACKHFPLDWLWTGDDVAGQQTLIMSPLVWRNMIKPLLKRVVDVGKSFSLPVAYHCCGALSSIIPDLIEIGVDVLNPVQCNCPGMNPIELNRAYGERLCFMGGVDTQCLLPTGTAKEVRQKTESLIEGMTCDGGGYILAASHAVPPETPDENIFALYDAAGITREEIGDRAADIRRWALRSDAAR
jgi:uroporphyrinogen decarboxylase